MRVLRLRGPFRPKVGPYPAVSWLVGRYLIWYDPPQSFCSLPSWACLNSWKFKTRSFYLFQGGISRMGRISAIFTSWRAWAERDRIVGMIAVLSADLVLAAFMLWLVVSGWMSAAGIVCRLSFKNYKITQFQTRFRLCLPHISDRFRLINLPI